MRGCCRDTGRELIDGGAVVVIDDLGNELSLVDALIVLNRHAAHVAGDLRGYRGQIGLQVCIIRRLPPGIGFPAVPARGDNQQDSHRQQ